MTDQSTGIRQNALLISTSGLPGSPGFKPSRIRATRSERTAGFDAAGMSCYSVAEEIMPGHADFLVERRGFEPHASDRCIRGHEAFFHRLPPPECLSTPKHTIFADRPICDGVKAPIYTIAARRLCAAEGRSRREAAIADRVRGRDSWADSAPTGAASGKTAVRAIAVVPL